MTTQKSLTVFSFGGGVQSCGIAALILKDALPKPDLILFADTGAEMPYTYETVERVFKELSQAGITCETVKADGSILDDPQNGRGGIASPPWFVKGDRKNIGMLRRQCTYDYKIVPIHKRIREAAGATKGKWLRKVQTLWLGISTDEAGRAKQPAEKWLQAQFPLIDLNFNRVDAALACYQHFGFVPEKSSCWFCPYTRPETWNERRAENPELFNMAVELDNRLEKLHQAKQAGISRRPYIHPSGIPLNEATNVQPALFNRKCEGYCWI